MFYPVGEETFASDHAHIGQLAVHRSGEEFFAQASEGGGVRAAEKKWRDGEIELINQAAGEKRAKEGRASLACDRSHFVIGAETLEHRRQIDSPRPTQMQCRFLH